MYGVVPCVPWRFLRDDFSLKHGGGTRKQEKLWWLYWANLVVVFFHAARSELLRLNTLLLVVEKKKKKKKKKDSFELCSRPEGVCYLFLFYFFLLSHGFTLCKIPCFFKVLLRAGDILRVHCEVSTTTYVRTWYFFCVGRKLNISRLKLEELTIQLGIAYRSPLGCQSIGFVRLFGFFVGEATR